MFVYVFLYINIYIGMKRNRKPICIQHIVIRIDLQRTCIVYPLCKKNKGYWMHDSDAISILNCAFYCPCFFRHGFRSHLQLLGFTYIFSEIYYKSGMVDKITY